MPTYKIELRTDRESKKGLFPIRIVLFDSKRIIYEPIKWKVSEENWDFDKCRVKGKHRDKTVINSVIDSKEAAIKQYFAQCEINREPADITTIFNTAEKPRTSGKSFSDYLLHRSKQYYQQGKIGMYRIAERFSREVKEYFGNITAKEIDLDKVRDFDGWLTTEKENTQNGRRKKFAFYSQFYGELMEEGKAPGPNPFRKYRINKVPVKKEKLTVKEIEALEKVELKDPNLNDARNLFLFAYYCKGIRFEIAVTMKKADIKNGRLYFQTNKGRKHLSVAIHPRLRQIIAQYKKLDSPFIFPMIAGKDIETVLAYYEKETKENKDKYMRVLYIRNSIQNERLQKAAKLAGVKTHISMHVARHTFAYHLKQNTDNIHVIKDALGHSTSQQTEDYLKQLDDETIDREVAKLYGS